MARQLGQYLLDNGAINSEQLHVALEAQVRFGGRLGFNLVDLGYLSPVDLTRYLGAFHGIDAVEPTEVRGIRWDVLNSIPRELALKHRAIPISMNKGRITVVMSDPSNLQALDEMSFATGRSIQVRVAPDFIIKRALETYFGATFVELVRPQQAQEIENLKQQGAKGAQVGAAASVRSSAAQSVGTVNGGDVPVETLPGLELQPSRWNRALDEDEWLSGRKKPAVRVESPAAPPPAPGSVAPLDDLGPVLVGEPVALGRGARKPIVAIRDLREACLDLAEARHSAAAAASLLGFTSSFFERTALFRIGPGRLRGWRLAGSHLTETTFRSVRVPITGGLPREATLASGLIVRELRLDPSGVVLARALGGSAIPRTVCVARLDVRGEPAAIFYADDGVSPGSGSPSTPALTQRLQGRLRSDLEILLRKTEVALEMVSMLRWLPRT